MQGLAENKDELGAPLWPCRHYDDKQAEANQGFWNCPCVPMRERKVCMERRLHPHLLIEHNRQNDASLQFSRLPRLLLYPDMNPGFVYD